MKKVTPKWIPYDADPFTNSTVIGYFHAQWRTDRKGYCTSDKKFKPKQQSDDVHTIVYSGENVYLGERVSLKGWHSGR
jgi:serine protease inhibitor